MAKLRHDTSDFTNLDVAGLASTLQSLLLPQVPASAHRLRLLANKLEHVATCLRDQAESMQLQPVAALEQRQSDRGAEGYAANPERFSASEHTAAQTQNGTLQLPAAASMRAEQPQHLSEPGSQHDFDTHSAQLAAPQIITAEGQSRRSKRKLDKPLLFDEYQQRYVALEVFYLGWQYHGFASQTGIENTIEGHLFRAMRKAKLIQEAATWQDLQYSRCGRTDKGVSAAGQVISLRLRSKNKVGQAVLSEEQEMDYSLKMNKELPADIRVLGWTTIPADFSARFNTRHREYTYFIVQHGQLDIAAMQEAAAHFIGEHDFRNFCKVDAEHVKNFVRTILDFRVKLVQPPGTDGRALYALHIAGTAFLWHQVRCMAAVLLMVGKHLEQPEIVQQLLDVQLTPCKPQYNYASEEPLLFSKCCYHNLTFRTSDKNRLQTLQAVEKMVDKHRMGCNIYMQIAEKLNLACQPFQDLRRSMQLASVPHVELLKRITEPSLPERMSSLVDVGMNAYGQRCQTASSSQLDSM